MNRLENTADRMNGKLAKAGIDSRWELDTDTFSNSVGSWFLAELGGVTDAQSMRDATDRLIARESVNQ